MSTRYRVDDLLLFATDRPTFSVNITFQLKKQQRVNLADLIGQIESVELNDHLSCDTLRSLLIQLVESLSKFAATDLDVSVVVHDRRHLVSPTHSCYSFPGCYDDQTINLIVDQSQFQTGHSVLIFAFESTRLLLVNHGKRGWELPGGRLEGNESEVDAIVRETWEESAAQLIRDSIQPIAQYQFFDEKEGRVHRRTVFVGLVHALKAHLLGMETTDRQLISPPTWTDAQIFNADEHFSQYLKDNVYPICLKLAITKLQSKT